MSIFKKNKINNINQNIVKSDELTIFKEKLNYIIKKMKHEFDHVINNYDAYTLMQIEENINIIKTLRQEGLNLIKEQDFNIFTTKISNDENKIYEYIITKNSIPYEMQLNYFFFKFPENFDYQKLTDMAPILKRTFNGDYVNCSSKLFERTCFEGMMRTGLTDKEINDILNFEDYIKNSSNLKFYTENKFSYKVKETEAEY